MSRITSRIALLALMVAAPLTQTREELRGGMTFRAFDIVYPNKSLRLTTYTYPNGKLEQ
jgi:hypothetical protein